MTRQNLAIFERAMKMFTPFAAGREGAAPSPPTARPKPAGAKPSEEISELKSEIEAMRRQLAELAQQRK